MSQSILPTPEAGKVEYRICCPGLPLAVYREVAAHLRQVSGVEVDLLPQTATQFNYYDSQVGGLKIFYTLADQVAQQRVEQILTYYGDRYGDWETVKR